MHQTAWLAACLTLLLGASASAQTTFLSNDGFAHDDSPLWLSEGGSQFAQPFRSGELSTDEIAANTAWLVTEVRVRLNFDNTRQVPTAKLCESRGSRAEKCRDLRGPTSASSGEQIIRYTHSGYPLESNMRRYLVLYWGGQPDEDVVLVPTTHTRESRSSVGWELPGRLEVRIPRPSGDTDDSHWFRTVTAVSALGIEIRGRKGPTPPTAANVEDNKAPSAALIEKAAQVRAVNRIGKSFSFNRAEATPEAPEVFTLDFAHFANGTGITSDLVLVNVSPHPIRQALYFYDQEGDLIDPESVVDVTGDLELAEDGSLSVLTEMEPLGQLTISTHGQDELVSGSVKVLSDGPIGGGVRYGVPEIGVAGVGASQPVRDGPVPGPPPGRRNPHGGGAAQPGRGSDRGELPIAERGRRAGRSGDSSGGQRAVFLVH